MIDSDPVGSVYFWLSWIQICIYGSTTLVLVVSLAKPKLNLKYFAKHFRLARNCPFLKRLAVIGGEERRFGAGMSDDWLNTVMGSCPQLTYLEVSGDYCSGFSAPARRRAASQRPLLQILTNRWFMPELYDAGLFSAFLKVMKIKQKIWSIPKHIPIFFLIPQIFMCSFPKIGEPLSYLYIRCQLTTFILTNLSLDSNSLSCLPIVHF